MTQEHKKTMISAKELATVGIFAALTAVLAQIAVPLPFTPMPISFGLVAVYFTGMLLKPKEAVLAQITYLLLGAVGIPVFGNFRGGMGALFGPTGGYLMVYPVMAWLVSAALNRAEGRGKETAKGRGYLHAKAALAICFAHIILYLGGTLWLSATTGSNFYGALTLAVFPFIPLDIVKIIFCVVAGLSLRARLIRLNVLELEEAGHEAFD